MTQKEKDWVVQCIRTDVSQFYESRRWKKLRGQILKQDHFECQVCKQKYHRYRRANTVHHVNLLKVRPDLALEAMYRDPATHTDKRNLISLCHDCHEEVHGYRMPKEKTTEALTEERWD
jgi:5-methylcytosine-specific restriction endonuclease McrA